MSDIKNDAVKFTYQELQVKDIWEVVTLLMQYSVTDGEHHKQYAILAALQILISKDKWEDFKDIYQPQDGIPD